jgi:hypothetical protein
MLPLLSVGSHEAVAPRVYQFDYAGILAIV